jgi:hypothetical protein
MGRALRFLVVVFVLTGAVEFWVVTRCMVECAGWDHSY